MSIMNKYAQAWVDALRSGEYEQHRGALRKGKKFCCLGVACDLIDPKGWYHSMHSGEENILPDRIRKVLGLRNASGHLPTTADLFEGAERRPDMIPQFHSLMFLNDIAGLSFKEIAKAIEDHADDLFEKETSH